MPFHRTEAEELHAVVVAARAAVREKQHAERTLAGARERLAELEGRLAGLEETHAREAREYARVEGEGVTALFWKLVGDIDEKRRKERAEMLAAALRLDEARAERKLRREEIATLESRIAGLAHAPAAWEEALARKEAWLRANDEEAARALAAITDEEATLAAEARELREAADAADHATFAFEVVQKSLDSASGWSTADMLGGGGLATSIKRDHLDDAHLALPAAQQRLDRLRSECADVGISFVAPSLAIDRSGWFTDLFLDNIFSDLSVGRRIETSLTAANQTLAAIATARQDIAERAERSNGRRETLQDEWLRIVGG